MGSDTRGPANVIVLSATIRPSGFDSIVATLGQQDVNRAVKKTMKHFRW